MLTFELQKKLLSLRMKLETEKEVALRKICQRLELEKAFSKLRQETEQAKIELEGEVDFG